MKHSAQAKSTRSPIKKKHRSARKVEQSDSRKQLRFKDRPEDESILTEESVVDKQENQKRG